MHLANVNVTSCTTGTHWGHGCLGSVLKVPLPCREGLGEGRFSHDPSPSPSLSPEGRGDLKRSLVLTLLTVLPLVGGCGGLNQTDMRKYAIKRPSDDEDAGLCHVRPNAHEPDRPV